MKYKYTWLFGILFGGPLILLWGLIFSNFVNSSIGVCIYIAIAYGCCGCLFCYLTDKKTKRKKKKSKI